MAITLGNVSVGKPIDPQYLVLDASNGKEYGYYDAPISFGRLGRFTREEGFVFLKAEEKNMKRSVRLLKANSLDLGTDRG